MSKLQKGLPDDQEIIGKVCDILLIIFSSLPFDANHIVGAAWSLIADNFHDSGHSFEDFKAENERMVEFMKSRWEE